MSQTDVIRRHLELGRAITALEALQQYGCFRLAARIAELREAGVAIRVDRVEVGDGKHVAQYRLG